MTCHVLRYYRLSPAHCRVASWEDGRIGREVYNAESAVHEGHAVRNMSHQIIAKSLIHISRLLEIELTVNKEDKLVT